MPKWEYHSESIPGSLHSATHFINDYHPEWDVVAMETVGYNTIVVWRKLRPKGKPSKTSSTRSAR